LGNCKQNFAIMPTMSSLFAASAFVLVGFPTSASQNNDHSDAMHNCSKVAKYLGALQLARIKPHGESWQLKPYAFFVLCCCSS
jgi:hypothetical protein